MEILKCDHIHLKTENVVETSKWYCDILGGEITHEGEFKGSKVRYVTIKGLNFVIFSRLDEEQEVLPSSIKPRYGVDHFGFLVKDLQKAVEELRRKNVRIVEEPWEVRPGVSIAYIEGPDQVRIELTQRD